MPAAHRHGDARVCGATTQVAGQGTVYVNGQLWAVDGDPNSHGGGGLIPGGGGEVYIEGKKVIVNAADNANPDALCIPIGPPHCNPATAAGSGDVYSGG